MSKVENLDICENEQESVGCPKFNPPMSIQRYSKVLDIFSSSDILIKKVIDFGCSDMNFLRRLKFLEGVEEIALIDKNKDLLEHYSNLKAAPQASDFIFKRLEPLTVSVYSGSVAECDHRLKHYDAVCCIELIEHLTEIDLEKFPCTIFGYMNPKLVIITTPNADFNVLFPGMKGFRHFDHKFEWTREEFKQWCNKVIEQYPYYDFEIDGVGNGPADSEGLGFCTQIAIFRHKLPVCDERAADGETSYTLLNRYEYPFRSLFERITNEVQYQTYRMAERLRATSNSGTVLLAKDELYRNVKRVHRQLDSEQTFSEVLQSANYKIVSNEGQFFIEYHLPMIDNEDNLDEDGT